MSGTSAVGMKPERIPASVSEHGSSCEFRQLRRAEHGLVAHEERRVDLGVAVLGRVQVEHELRQRPLQPRQRALQHNEARAGEFRGGLEIHQAERLADLEMLLRLEGELLWRADFAQLDIGLLVSADRHVPRGKVRNGGEQIEKLLV